MIEKIYNGKDYAIYEIPNDEENVHQYKIFIKDFVRVQNTSAQMDRDFYCLFSDGLPKAHLIAEDVLARYFIKSP